MPEVEPPAELLAKIAFQIPAESATKSGIRAWVLGWVQPLIRPRFAMGMAMTILSFSMLGRFAGIDSSAVEALGFGAHEGMGCGR